MPNAAFLLLVGGVLLIYCEFIWVGKIIFGMLGGFLSLAGLSMLLRLPGSALELSLILAAVACFFIEGIVGKYYVAGLLATILLACCFWRMGVSPELAFPVTLVFGAITTALLSKARQARRNKYTLT